MVNFEEDKLTYMQKISFLTNTPMEYIQKFRDMGLINESEARNLVIRSDFLLLKKEGGRTVKKIMAILRAKYNIEVRQLQNIVYANVSHAYYCKRCGRRIDFYHHTKYDDFCQKCIETLNLKKLYETG